jgi:Uma2 family endonuclease
MSYAIPRALIALRYEKYAQEYLGSLPQEHFMESIAQATQRKITVASLDLVSAERDDLHVYNELLVQYARKRQRKPGQVVPDNMVVVSEEPPRAELSYNVPLEPAGPFWVMEYVSKSNERKDYEDNFHKYERELKVPYYMVFNRDAREMTLFRHNGKKYVTVRPNEHGRYEVPELKIEVALLDGWVRYWYKGKLLLLPAELQRAMDEANRRADQEKRRADQANLRADEEKQRADQANLRADQEKQRADQANLRADALEAEIARLRNFAG